MFYNHKKVPLKYFFCSYINSSIHIVPQIDPIRMKPICTNIWVKCNTPRILIIPPQTNKGKMQYPRTDTDSKNEIWPPRVRVLNVMTTDPPKQAANNVRNWVGSWLIVFYCWWRCQIQVPWRKVPIDPRSLIFWFVVMWERALH